MQITLDVKDSYVDEFMSFLKSMSDKVKIEESNEIDLTDKLKSSLEDVKLMRENKKEKVDIEDFLDEL